MAVTHEDMESVLKELGCRSVHKVNKVAEYMLCGTREPFYVHAENRYPKIIVRPVIKYIAPELGELAGVHSQPCFYHNSNLRRFPRRLHTGEGECNYGWGFEFENSLAVKAFIEKLVRLVGS